MRKKCDIALLIADRDEEFANFNVKSLSAYKVDQTDFELGRSIENIADTVHHTDSIHSRFIQLADVYTYASALEMQKDLKGHRADLVNYIKTLPYFYPRKYKYWP
jgi:hypothetical protein